MSTVLVMGSARFSAARLSPGAGLLFAFSAVGSILRSLRITVIFIARRLGRFTRPMSRFMNREMSRILSRPTCSFKIGSFSPRPVFIKSFLQLKVGAVLNFSTSISATALLGTAS